MSIPGVKDRVVLIPIAFLDLDVTSKENEWFDNRSDQFVFRAGTVSASGLRTGWWRGWFAAKSVEKLTGALGEQIGFCSRGAALGIAAK
jgi:hypothetical protein